MAVLSYSEGGKGDWPVIDDGVYPAQITDVQDTESSKYQTKDGAPKPQVQLDFTIPADECDQEEDMRIRMWVGASFGPKSNLTPIIEAVLGVTPGPGVDVDTDDLFEKRCQVVVGHYTNNEGVVRNKIVKVLAPKRRKAAPAPPPVEEEEEEEEEDEEVSDNHDGRTPMPSPKREPVGAAKAKVPF